MVQFIKAYSVEGNTLFELGVKAANRKGAKARAATSLLVRRPGEIPAAEIVDVMALGDGVVKEYRVVIKIEDGSNIKDIVKLSDALDAFEELV